MDHGPRVTRRSKSGLSVEGRNLDAASDTTSERDTDAAPPGAGTGADISGLTMERLPAADGACMDLSTMRENHQRRAKDIGTVSSIAKSKVAATAPGMIWGD